MTTQPDNKLARLKAYAKAEIKAGRQIHWDVGFVVSRPALKHIRFWYPDLPPDLNKSQAIQWLAEKASEHAK